MTVHLIDGHAGRPHVTSGDVAWLNTALMGAGDGVFDFRSRLRISVTGSNSVEIGDGAAMVGGLRFTVPTIERIELSGGTDGMKRYDIIYAQYTAEGGVEKVKLLESRGDPVESNPTPPSVPSGALPLWRVLFDGRSITETKQLFKVLPALDSMRAEMLYENAYWRVVRHGGAVSVFARGIITSGDPYATLDCRYTVPEGLRPATEVLAACCTQGGGAGSAFIRVTPNGVISIGQLGGTGTREPRYGQLTWVPGM